ncbi:MAG: hypothetical protein HYV27_19735 [Candidatus Hydrogenedentes bacterium]|nr:hypothetical protein [Candidatus Hydrogenedentota bacterium]
MAKYLPVGVCCALAAALIASSSDAQPQFERQANGVIHAGGYTFDSWGAYLGSDYFKANGLRCKTGTSKAGPSPKGSQADCSFLATNPAGEYAPEVERYRIPVVVHVIMNTNGDGALSDAMILSQIDVLNEDFLALPASSGADGTDVQIEFYLATEDPDGQPTTGITRSTNNDWFDDVANYKSVLAWDTHRYLNIYTNTAGGALGYAILPQYNAAGNSQDGVVILHAAFGKDSGFVPYDLGRTATHEVGHYLGLLHTFESGCDDAAAPGCYNTADLICDTNPEAFENYGCPAAATSCNASPDPIHNYMDYTDDACMFEFTPEQARRMRCSLLNWRPSLYQIAEPDDTGGGAIESSRANGFIQDGHGLVLTAPAGTGHSWYRGGVPIVTEGERLTGVDSPSLIFDPVLESDAGIYTCAFNNGNKALVETAPFTLMVLPPNSLPAGAWISIAALMAAITAFTLRLFRRSQAE